MAIRYVASINAADYDAVRRLLPNDFPANFGQWEFLRTARQAKLEGSGFSTLDFRINPSAYLAQCEQDNSYLGIEGLWRFAEEQGLQSSRHRS
jgi:hypothetical protein